MSRYSLTHLADSTLLRDLAALVARDRVTTAELLAHLAEVDTRKLHLPAAYPSMYAYCLGELRMSEDESYKRIQAARAARRFPVIFGALAEGRLHLSAVVLLAPHLTEATADELLAAAAHKTKAEIERLLAARFPRPDVLAWVEAVPACSVPLSGDPPGPGPAGDSPGSIAAQLVPEPVHAPPAPAPAGDRSRVKPLSPQSFAVQFTLSRRAHERLRYAQALLGHEVPSGDIAQVVERAVEALVEKLEKQKFAVAAKPRTGQHRATPNGRRIPAHVRRAVWERDGGRCTFVSATGRRCPARTRLETLWNDGPAVVGSCRLREERPTVVARSHPRSRVSASGARAAYERSPS